MTQEDTFRTCVKRAIPEPSAITAVRSDARSWQRAGLASRAVSHFACPRHRPHPYRVPDTHPGPFFALQAVNCKSRCSRREVTVV